MREFTLTKHAVQRYMERVRQVYVSGSDPLLSAGRREIERILPMGEWSDDPPDWDRWPSASGYWRLGDDIVFVIVGNSAVTCIVRGTLTPGERARRNRLRRKRRYAKRRGDGHSSLHGVRSRRGGEAGDA